MVQFQFVSLICVDTLFLWLVFQVLLSTLDILSFSFVLNEEPPDPSKKRKLPFVNLDFPLSKHRFRDLPCRLDTESSVDDNTITEEDMEEVYDVWGENEKIQNTTDFSVELSNHSKSNVGGCDTLYEGNNTVTSSMNVNHSDLPSTSFSSSVTGTTLQEPQEPSNSPENKIVRGREHVKFSAFEPEERDSDIQPEPLNKKCRPLDSKDEEIDQYEDVGDDNFLLYSNHTSPNEYVLSSGRWKVGEAPSVTRKPTIDKEFEQYFSMLML